LATSDRVVFDGFTIGDWAGATALLAMIPLAVTSNRRSISGMGARRWQQLHRLSYAIYAFVAVHVVALQFGESRAAVWVLLTAGVFAPVIPLRLLRRYRVRGDRIRRTTPARVGTATFDA
jgi:DMSO/TMAO reductase YedYZ heme-binding membrane subunit